jgi:hypothetical protein
MYLTKTQPDHAMMQLRLLHTDMVCRKARTAAGTVLGKCTRYVMHIF